MKKSPFILLAGLCATGLLSGLAARRLTAERRVPANPVDAGREATAGNTGGDISSGPSGRKIPVSRMPALHSTDTVETLLAVNDGTLYSRLALWLSEAGEPDIAAYWNACRQKKPSNDITDLVFINWTRLDPAACTAAVAGKPEEHHAWWAWACHDPKAALAAAIAKNPNRVNNVTWGIGEFHPQWLRDHFKEIPESGKGNAMQGMMKWEDGQDPLASLDFMKQNGLGTNAGTLKALVRKDPWAAIDWVKANPNSRGGYYGSLDDPMALIVKTMAEEKPEDLERLAAQTPSGEVKRKMEAALFANLVKTDPQAAIEQAKATDVPRLAAERYAAVGSGLLKSDPEKAMEIAASLFAACPDAMSRMTRIEYPGGASGGGGAVAGVSAFMNELMARQPAELLELTVGLPDGHFNSSSFNELAGNWADENVVAYTGWVNQQTDRAIREKGARILINQLRQEEHYAEAAEWALTVEDRGNLMGNLLNNWRRSDPAEADQWLESLDMPAAEKARLKSNSQ